MNIGQLRHQVVIETRHNIADETGGRDVSWSALATVWANIKPQHGNENLRAEATASTQTLVVTIRHRDDVKPDMRFVFDGRVFDIVSVINLAEENRWLSCKCKERPL